MRSQSGERCEIFFSALCAVGFDIEPFGDISRFSSFEKAKSYAADYPKVYKAIRRLEDLDAVLKVYDVDKYVTYEFGMLSSYHYYTGVIFSGYTYGSGEPIVKGGRYDKLLTYFGKKAPSIGFGIVVDQLMAALSRQKIQLAVEDHTTLLVFTEEKIQQAIARAQQLRGDGNDVTMIPFATAHTREDYENYAQKNHISNVEFMDGDA